MHDFNCVLDPLEEFKCSPDPLAVAGEGWNIGGWRKGRESSAPTEVFKSFHLCIRW